MSNKQNEIITSFTNEIQNCEAVIELGANIGSITKKILIHNKPVYAFEPEPEAFKHLSSIKSHNLTKINKAAWIKNQTMQLHRHKDWLNTKSHTSSSLKIDKKNVDNKNSINCETIDIADYILSLNKKVLIKMDVEGAEYELIHHLLDKKVFKNITYIFCEFHPKKIKYGFLKHLMLNIRLMRLGQKNKIKRWF